MAKYVCMGAMLKCTFGQIPSTLMVTNPLRPMIQNKPKATIMDFAPMVNVMPFGMCTTLSNPMVVSSNGGSHGNFDTDALYPGSGRAVGSWRKTVDYQYAGTS